MRDFLSDDDLDIERMIAVIGAPPAAPLAVVRQRLEREKDATQTGLLPRLLGVISPKAGQ